MEGNHTEAISGEAQPRRLLDLVRDAVRRKHYSYRTEQAYVHWIKRFIFFTGKRQRTQQLTLIAAPFQEACKAVTGCVSAPAGWERKTDSAGGAVYYKSGDALDMVYTATQTEFEIRWHIGTDVYLNATGGKGKELKIEREVK